MWVELIGGPVCGGVFKLEELYADTIGLRIVATGRLHIYLYVLGRWLYFGVVNDGEANNPPRVPLVSAVIRTKKASNS